MIIGDLIHSSEISPKYRALVHTDLEAIIATYGDRYAIYRGDTFQIELLWTPQWIRKVVELKAKLKKHEYGAYQMDARLGIGIGQITYRSDSVQTSDGPVYAHASDALQLTYDTISNLFVLGNTHVDKRYFNIVLSLIDHICASWTARQAEIISYYLVDMTQKEIAKKLGVSQSTIQRSLSASSAQLLKNILETLSVLQSEA